MLTLVLLAVAVAAAAVAIYALARADHIAQRIVNRVLDRELGRRPWWVAAMLREEGVSK